MPLPSMFVKKPLIPQAAAYPAAPANGFEYQDPMANLGEIDRIKYLQKNNPEALMSLAAGLMSGNMAEGFAGAGSAMSDYRKGDMKRQEEAQAREQTKQYYLSQGLTEAEANAASINENIGSSYLNRKELEEKARLAQQYGNSDANLPTSIQEYQLSQKDPEFAKYLMTNKGRDSKLTVGDRAAVREADDAARSSQETIDMLDSVLAKDPNTGISLNEKAGSGSFAKGQAWLARNDPTGIMNTEQGQATTELENVVLSQALSSLKAIFGAAPTEGERQILVDLQASVDKTPQEREVIIRRATAAAKRRQSYNMDRANELRGGTYYDPGNGYNPGEVPQPQMDQPTSNPPPAVPPVDTIDGGFRFKGGNPADPNSWEKVQ